MNGTQAVRRNVCRLGFSPRFMGGDVNNAASWNCVQSQLNFTFVNVAEAPGAGPVTVNGAATLIGHGLAMVAAVAIGASLML